MKYPYFVYYYAYDQSVTGHPKTCCVAKELPLRDPHEQVLSPGSIRVPHFRPKFKTNIYINKF